MTGVSVRLREAEAGEGDLDRIETLLEASGLPTRDVRAKPESFFVGVSGGTVVGAGGVERYGSAGLLRSVVVEESRRGRGYGTALCDELEAHAREVGIEALYLLTTTASTFFRERGYRAIDRESVPARVRGTTEFTDLCPTSADCLYKPLR